MKTLGAKTVDLGTMGSYVFVARYSSDLAVMAQRAHVSTGARVNQIGKFAWLQNRQFYSQKRERWIAARGRI